MYFWKRKQSCLPHMSLDENIWFFTGRWDHKLELSQEVMDTHSLQHGNGG